MDIKSDSVSQVAKKKTQKGTEVQKDLLELKDVLIFNPNNNQAEKLTSKEKNYYRATDIFGDTATKPNQYPNQGYIPSTINEKTKATPFVENVVANVKGTFSKETARDAKMSDIFAKQIGTWFSAGKSIGGGFNLEKTDAYKFALSINSDDYTIRESEYKGKKEQHAYLDTKKTDGKISLFSTEIQNGKEYITMRDSTGKIHWFDKSDNLKETII